MVTETDFTNLREKIVANDQSLMEKDFTSTLPNLLTVLGHPVGELRDAIGWTTLSAYFRSNLCPGEARIASLDLLLSEEFLFFKIENGETSDSVKRSFSSLTIADILIGDVINGANLDSPKISRVSQTLSRYLNMERDWRGHDKNLGWIHALAHLGDAFWTLAGHPSLIQKETIDCLTTLLSHIEMRGHLVFSWQEDFRLARAISSMLENLPEETAKIIIEQRYPKAELYGMPALQNILTTFRCVYLELNWNSSKKIMLTETIKGLIY